MLNKYLLLLFTLFFTSVALGQQLTVSGIVKDQAAGSGVPNATLQFSGGSSISIACDSTGAFHIQLPGGKYTVVVKATGYASQSFSWEVMPSTLIKIFTIKSTVTQLSTVTVKGQQQHLADVRLLTQTVGTTIYSGKKNELIDLNNTPANTAANSARQIYAKVPGINIIENDEAGIQLGIATRGLNPNRTTEFNSRQNGYDIAADPIGYPETYYTPSTDGLDAIEIIRGAASLQYGTQFGGLLNFKFKQGPTDAPFELVTKQTAGSYGFFNSFNSIGGQDGKLNYYAFYDFKRGDGWRQNTGFDVHNAYVSFKYALTSKLTLGFDYTFMYYQMQQPGGLTDAEFKADPRQSLRSRNWFSANWNIPALTLDYAIDTTSLLSVKAYALIADRKNVGDLNPIIYPDNPSTPRTVMDDDYRNFYLEGRYIKHYKFIDNLSSSFLAGVRFYHGDTHRIQGNNNTGSNANFSVDDPGNFADRLQVPLLQRRCFCGKRVPADQ